MNQELGFETIPFEIAPEFQSEVFEEESEKGGSRRFAGGANRSFRPSSRPGLRPKGTKPPPIPRPRPIPRRPRRPWEVIRGPYGPVSEPYPVEPEPSYGSERVRWVQDCLNQAMKMQLPVTGVMGPETRSAVRSFQKQQGLRASGIVSPKTEQALSSACEGGQDSRAPSEEMEDFSEVLASNGEMELESPPPVSPLRATFRLECPAAGCAPFPADQCHTILRRAVLDSVSGWRWTAFLGRRPAAPSAAPKRVLQRTQR